MHEMSKEIKVGITKMLIGKKSTENLSSKKYI
jgi:hypothetical protein